MAKIREELEIVSSDDLNALLDRIKKVANEVKNVNNTPIKPETNSSEIDKANAKLDNLRKNAQNGINTKVNVQLDASDLKKLNNLPTAKMKVDFLVDKGTISKSIGKDLQAAIGKAYSDVNRKFKDFPGLDKEPNISLDNFIKKIPELSARQRSGILQTLAKNGLPVNTLPSTYETVYRLKSYLEDAKNSVSKKGNFTTPSGAFSAPDLSLSTAEYGNAINEQVKFVQNVLTASKFFADLGSEWNVKAKTNVSPKEMYKLMGVGTEKADTGNYVAYLADQIAKKANVYDIIDQVVAGTLDPTQINIDDVRKKLESTIIKASDKTFAKTSLSVARSKFVNNYINKTIDELEKEILNDPVFGKSIGDNVKNVRAVAERLSDKIGDSPKRSSKFIGLMSAYLAKGGAGIQNEAVYKEILNQIALDPNRAQKKDDIFNVIQNGTTLTLPSTPKSSSTTKKKTKSVGEKVTKKTTGLTDEQLGKLYHDLDNAYENYMDAKSAYSMHNIFPSAYALSHATYRDAYVKALPYLPTSEIENITGKAPMSFKKAQALADYTQKTTKQLYSIKNPIKDLGYSRENNPDIFELFDQIGRRIININDNRYHNRKNQNGDTDKIIQNIEKTNELANQLEDIIRADGHSGFTLKGIPARVKQPVSKSISSPTIPTPEQASETDTKKQIQQSKDTVKAKEKEADAVVTANDKITDSEKKVASVIAPIQSISGNSDVEKDTKKTANVIAKTTDQTVDDKARQAGAIVDNNNRIAESEKKVADQVVNTAKVQKDAIKTVSSLKNNNFDLTEEPVTPPELEGLKQLSQKEFGDAQKYIKVYEDTNRTIYTLTQTYKKQFDSNGNLLAEGYENTIAYYDSYEKLEKEAIALSKRINSNYAKLDTEKYKATNKQNSNLIQKLQDDIKSDQQDLSELHRIARLHSSLPDNDYVYQNFTQALRKGSAESSRALASTRKTNRDNFDFQKETINTDLSKQISDVESLGQAGLIAAAKLRSIQQALSGITTPTGLENVKKQINDIGKQFDTNKIRENALNYVHNLGQKLNGKQNVVIGQKSVSDDFADSIKNGEWTGPLAGLNSKFESKYQNTSADLKRYIADAQMLGDVGKEAAASFSTLQKNLENCYTESGLEQIQNGMKTTQKQLAAAKKQAEETAKNSEATKIKDQYTQIMSDMSNLEKKNKELRTALKGNQNADYIKNISAERDAYKQAIAGADEYIDKHKEILGDKAVKQYNTAKSRANQAETNIENDIAAQAKAIDTKAYTDKYTSAITDVKALGEAYRELGNIQKEAFSKKSGQSVTTLDDYNQKISDAQNKVKTLTAKVKDFHDKVWSADATQADKLNQKVFDDYEKQFSNMSDTKDTYTSNLVEAMKTAYQLKRSTEATLLKKAMNVSLDSGQSAELKGENSYMSQFYGSLRGQVIEQLGKDFQEQAISDLKTNANSQRSDILNTNFKTLSDNISQYVSSVTKAGRASEQFQNVFSGISTDLVNLQNNFSDPSKLNSQGISDYFDQMNTIAKNFADWKYTFSTGKGKASLDFTQALGEINDAKSGKNSNYIKLAQSYVDTYSNIWSEYDKNIKQFSEGSTKRQQLTAQAEKESADVIKKMQNLAKNAEKYNQTTSKGTELEWTSGKTKNTKDASAFLTQYANSIGLTSEISTKINEATGQVTKTFTDISGNTVTLTGNIDKLNNSLRVTQSLTSKNGSGMSSFGNTLKGMVSGNFKGAIADIASYVSYFQVTMKAIQQAKQGFNDFLNYSSDLTNISYTMDLSQNQLQNLGSSAIDMAKDLSMSLDNTMDIYKIYANMNTTASEIQQTARPTAILSNLSGVDASTAADQVQGILQQFHMLEDGSTTAADASMHIVDVLDKVSGSVGIDYAKGIKIISDAVQASGQVAYDAGMSYEQLAAITAKVSERTREDGSSIGNALKTIITRTTKVGKMPQYADEVDNATLSNASASLHAIGVDVYNPDGSDRGIITVMSELKDKWNDLTDAQQAKIAFDVAATRQTSKFKSMLDAFTDSMSLAEEATTANGNAEANQEKYMESTAGKLQAIKTQMQDFWVNFYNSGTVNGVLEFVHSLTEGFTSLEKTLGPIPALLTAVFAAMTVKNATMAGLKFLSGGGLATVVG